MAVKIDPPFDDRAERMIANPAAYFEQAREEARRQIEQEMHQRECAARKRR